MRERLLFVLGYGAMPLVFASPRLAVADDTWWQSADWVAAVGQCLGALFTAIAALLALGAVRATRQAAKSQTEGETVASLLTRYAEPDMYKALQGFGRFMGDVVGMQDRRAIARAVKPSRADTRTVRERYVGLEGAEAESALRRVLARLGYGQPLDNIHTEADAKQLIAHRRAIHHHFKLVWAALQAGVLAREHLRLVTEANYGYELWLTAALPVTIGLARADMRPLTSRRSDDWDLEWPWDLIKAVENSPPLKEVADSSVPL